jgi:ATP-dependent Clp protease ATP-binding subunit ClpA
MFERFGRDVRRVVVRAAEEEARARGSATVEAEHLLLALAASEADPAGRLLADEGLDHDSLADALDREEERSLAAIGVALADYPSATTTAPRRRSPRFATSSKQALHRTLDAATARKDRRISSAHLLIGLLRADIGTVPRALEMAGVDRVALLDRAERLLG